MMLDAQPLRDVVNRRLWSRRYVIERYMHERRVNYPAALKAVDRLFKTETMGITQADRWCITLGTNLEIEYPEVYGTTGACR